MMGLKAMLLLLLCQAIQQVTAATTRNPSTKTECRMVKCIAECFKGVDSDGCNICDCDNTCQVTQCPQGQKCIMRSVTCIRAPCYPQPQCVPDYDATTEYPTARIVCPELMCTCDYKRIVGPDGLSSECCHFLPNMLRCLCVECPLIRCPYDCSQAVDSNGCNTCSCENTCRDTECPAGQKCVMVDVACFVAPCYPQPQCVPNDGVLETTVSPTTIKACPQIMCPIDCKRIVGPGGCPRCDCSNTCAATLCPVDQQCVMTDVVCKKAPCDRQPTCVPNDEPKTCPRRIECREPCEADLGPDGCYSKCSCPQTCKDIKCKADEVCDLVQVNCFRAPCFPIPTCFPRNRTCSQRPNVDRCSGRFRTQWTYNSNTKACESFPYYGCTPSPNTFNSRRECSNLCVQGLSCPPARVMCTKNCYWGQRSPETCPECICPCQTVRCMENTECRLKEGDCSKGEPCYPTAYCAPV